MLRNRLLCAGQAIGRNGIPAAQIDGSVRGPGVGVEHRSAAKGEWSEQFVILPLDTAGIFVTSEAFDRSIGGSAGGVPDHEHAIVAEVDPVVARCQLINSPAEAARPRTPPPAALTHDGGRPRYRRERIRALDTGRRSTRPGSKESASQSIPSGSPSHSRISLCSSSEGSASTSRRRS